MSKIPTMVVCGALSLLGFGAGVLSTSGSVASCAAAGFDPSVMSEQYWTIWNDDVQRKIDADIEANRKADALFEIDAPDGAEVKVEQIESAFRFGAHIFNTNACMRLAKGERNVGWVGTPKAISDRLDMMAKTGKPLHVSEVTIAAPGVSDRDRTIQAILTRNIYRVWFSHPKTLGITWWNTVDGAGVAGEPLVSGLFTRDMKKKPVYHALDQLINHEWRTETKVKVEGGGRSIVKFRGFKGRYRLSWTGADGKSLSKFVELK